MGAGVCMEQLVELVGFSTKVKYYSQIKEIGFPERSVLVSDQNVYPLIAPLLDSFEGKVIVLAAGEKEKNWESVTTVLDAAFELGLGRDDHMVGIGGGVVTDLTAFAASLYMRGCRLILYPTSLLAMVDAAFGGKTGMNYGGYKNMVGSFYPAHELHIISEFLQSLPNREYKGGMAEVVKHGFLSSGELLDFLEENLEAIQNKDPHILDSLLYEALSVKIAVVSEDLRESGVRAHLNLGHTFGHALEAISQFGLVSHGEAVAWGIVQAMKLGVHLGYTNKTYAQRVTKLLENFGFDLEIDNLAIDQIIMAMKKDKKQKAGQVRFVLQKSQGQTFTQAVDDKDLFHILSNRFHDFY
jgi:3-dehydroquinate synthase